MATLPSADAPVDQVSSQARPRVIRVLALHTYLTKNGRDASRFGLSKAISLQVLPSPINLTFVLQA